MTSTTTPTLRTGTWDVEPAHTEVGFTVRHLGLSKVRGRFSTFSGRVEVAEPLTASTISVEVDLASIDTNNDQRDEHLRSTDFFDVASHPTMTFASTEIRDAGDGTGTVVGELTIRGVTRRVELDAEFHGVGVDAYDTTRAGFSATTTISRKDFGIDFDVPLGSDAVLIGDKTAIELEVQLVPAS